MSDDIKESDFPGLTLPDKCMLEIPIGWENTVERTLRKLSSIGGIEILQVKEKFGGLRVYYSPYSDQADAIIADAEKECWATCDVCGEEGTLVRGDYLRVLCEKHREEIFGDDD